MVGINKAVELATGIKITVRRLRRVEGVCQVADRHYAFTLIPWMPAVTGGGMVADLLDSFFLSYNAGRIREGCQLFAQRMLADNATVGLALSGGLLQSEQSRGELRFQSWEHR